MKSNLGKAVVLFLGILVFSLAARSQETSGAITGTITDPSGSAVPDALVKATNLATNLEEVAHTKANGSYLLPELPAGTYKMTITKEGFKSETHTEILVNGNRTTTVDTSLQVGSVSSVVEVTAVPLMNQVDTTIGYVVDTQTIEETPLGTGSFTQLAILSPGVHADFLGGSGSNSGLGNQAIFANGNRDTSNSFSLNGVSTNNLFNGNSTSQVGENRFVLNTGENFGSNGTIQTSTSVYGAIGQALPTPPTDAIQEIAVNASMYDASQGNNSGAHISVLTKSGSNAIHGSAWEQFQNSAMNANQFFWNAAGTPIAFLNRNQFGATFGGPIKMDKLFYFLSYQGVRIADQSTSTKDVTVPLGLTNDRTAQGITNAINSSFCYPSNPSLPSYCPFQSSMVSTQAMNLLNAKLPNGSYLIPSAQITDPTRAVALGYDAVVQGPNSRANVDQGIASVDYVLNATDRLSGRYYFQSNPTTNPFGAVGTLLGFQQQLSAGSQVFSLANTVVLSPNLTWEQRLGFTRMRAYANTGQDFTPSQMGISLLGSTKFPDFSINTTDAQISQGIEFGPSTSFGDAGMFQNQWEYGTSVNLVKGRHTISLGFVWDHTQLNVINHNTNTDTLNFSDFGMFAQGLVDRGGTAFSGQANRYYRSDTVGAYANDNFKIRNNLTLTVGLRWDFDGPLSEKYGKLTAFDPSKYSYVQCQVHGVASDPAFNTCDPGTDVISNSGLLIAGNNPTAKTFGASDSLMQQHQWGFAPRIGIAWTPFSKLTLRTGYGIYYDRGELFSYLSPSAGNGFNGPFGVTLAPPFVQPISAAQNATLAAPFGTTPPPPPPDSAAGFLALLPNLNQTACGFPGCWPTATSMALSCLAVMTSTTNCRTRKTGRSISNISQPAPGCSTSDMWATMATI